MMKITPKYLSQIQQAGWRIDAVEVDRAIAGCPNEGCNLRVALKEGATVPTPCQQNPKPLPVISSYEPLRSFLFQRRKDLMLSMRDVQDIAGMAVDHLAKIEKNNPSRTPSLETIALWAGALGYELTLKPIAIPPLGLRIVCDTRRMQQTRFKTHRHRKAPEVTTEGKNAAGGSEPGPPCP